MSKTKKEPFLGVETEPMSEEQIKEGMGITEEPKVPQIDSPEWTGYVLSLLYKDEQANDLPKAVGLRRVARVVLPSKVKYQKTEVIVAQREYAVVKVTLILDDDSMVESVAECHSGNTDGNEFIQSAVATAETKAEARAYKRLLRLNILTADEHSRIAGNSVPSPKMTATEVAKDCATPNQMVFMEVLCRDRLKISVNHAILHILGVNNDIQSITNAQASTVLETLDQWTRDKSKMPEDLPKFIQDWRTQKL